MKNKKNNWHLNHAVTAMAIGFMALAFACSIRAALGLGMPIWEQELGWSRGDVSTIAAATLTIMAVIAPLSGLILDRQGLRFTLIFGLTLVCAASIVVSISDNLLVLFFGFGI